MAKRAVTVLGLGNMGRALAAVLKAAGHPVTGWNRTVHPGLVENLAMEPAGDPARAIESSDVVLSCLSSYAATDEVLARPGVATALEGKTLVQLSTGLAQEAAQMAKWAATRDVLYLDGKIAVVPRSIGLETTVIFYAGEQSVFQSELDILSSLGGRPTYVGTDPAAASIADFAFLCFFFLSTIGMLYGAAFCRAGGLDARKLFDLMPNFSKDIVERAPFFQKAFLSGDFMKEVQSSLKVDLNGAKLLGATAEQLRIAPEPAAFMVECFERAVAAGLGEADTGALIEHFLKAI
jgi:3-hydroxyisobutyrate dehydrogenase-like beta-hydroxyacid dehydrogenase